MTDEDQDPAILLRARLSGVDNIKKRKSKRSPVVHPTNTAISRFVVILLWFIFLHIGGLYFFTRGFLLTRLVLNSRSECDVSPVQDNYFLSSGEGCWYPRKFSRAVIVVIDALRYDFTVPPDTDQIKYFHNQLTTPYRIASQFPEHALLFKFIADPPTTTLQRLKGLTTGSLPTFIDMGSNFAGTEIEEDNIISQLNTANKRIAFLGDDTWLSLFPDSFMTKHTYPYDSFNVWDLHTVDNGVNEHIFPLLEKRNESQWDILIAHYLGVDHAGHRYGPDHEAMGAKLRQMDIVIQRLVENIDDETLLVVMGDHGMDSKGDHGGDSPGELEATLWMYSKRKTFGSYFDGGIGRSVAQIDFVPTISLLLGLPIPYNNLGAPIPEVFIDDQNDWNRNLATVVARITAAQIRRYQRQYKDSSNLDLGSRFDKQWEETEAAWTSLSKQRGWQSKTDEKAWKDLYLAYAEIQRENLHNCWKLWARFDPSSMIIGILLLFGSISNLTIYMLASRYLVDDAIGLTSLSRMLGAAAVSAVITRIFTSEQYVWCSGALMGGAIGFLWQIGIKVIKAFRNEKVEFLCRWDYLAILITVGHVGVFGSNSFTIWEDRIVHFFFATIAVLLAGSSLCNQDVERKTIGSYFSVLLLVLSRIASYSQLCREEQIPYCRTTFYVSESSSVSSPHVLGVLILSAIFLPIFIKRLLKRRGWYEGLVKEWIGVYLPLLLVLGSAYWFMDTVTNNGWWGFGDDSLNVIKTGLAQVVIGVALAGATVLYWFGPTSIDFQTLFGQQVGNVDADRGRNRVSVVIEGYSNAFGVAYLLFVLAWYTFASILQKPMGGISLAILIAQIVLTLEIIDINQIKSFSIGSTIFLLLAYCHFFTTGHQSNLPSIQWDTAFIPLSKIIHPWSGLLVIVNSFGSYILIAIAVPLLAMWNRHPREKDLLNRLASASSLHLLQHTLISTSTMIFAAYFRRHLMVWKIFAPRYMMGAIVLLTIDVALVLIGIVGGVWNTVHNVGGISVRLERLIER